MIQVHVDGAPLSADFGGMNTMGDLLELVKASIDPDTIITAIELNGETLSESEWNLPLSAHRDRTLQIKTGTKREYLGERLLLSRDIVEQIVAEFADAGDAYRKGFSPDGNTKLSRAVDDLGAFVTWYDSILDMCGTEVQDGRKQFLAFVTSLQQVCESILQQQLFNSWWVLSETINKRLNPQLEEIKTLCTKIADEIGRPS